MGIQIELLERFFIMQNHKPLDAANNQALLHFLEISIGTEPLRKEITDLEARENEQSSKLMQNASTIQELKI